MNKLEFIKTGAEIVVSIGVGAIVGNAVTLVSPTSTKAIMNFCIKAGKLALSGMVSDKASTYVRETIDSTVEKAKGWFGKEKLTEEESESIKEFIEKVENSIRETKETEA